MILLERHVRPDKMIESRFAACLTWVNLVVLILGQPLPVYPR
jgi:hypothetical protein